MPTMMLIMILMVVIMTRMITIMIAMTLIMKRRKIVIVMMMLMSMMIYMIMMIMIMILILNTMMMMMMMMRRRRRNIMIMILTIMITVIVILRSLNTRLVPPSRKTRKTLFRFQLWRPAYLRRHATSSSSCLQQPRQQPRQPPRLSSSIRVATLNAHSLRKKYVLVSDFIESSFGDGLGVLREFSEKRTLRRIEHYGYALSGRCILHIAPENRSIGKHLSPTSLRNQKGSGPPSTVSSAVGGVVERLRIYQRSLQRHFWSALQPKYR